jgi:hypothetical protein
MIILLKESIIYNTSLSLSLKINSILETSLGPVLNEISMALDKLTIPLFS